MLLRSKNDPTDCSSLRTPTNCCAVCPIRPQTAMRSVPFQLYKKQQRVQAEVFPAGKVSQYTLPFTPYRGCATGSQKNTRHALSARAACFSLEGSPLRVKASQCRMPVRAVREAAGRQVLKTRICRPQANRETDSVYSSTGFLRRPRRMAPTTVPTTRAMKYMIALPTTGKTKMPP